MVACLSHNGDASDMAQIDTLKTQIGGCITGEYGLGDIHLEYPGASIGIVAVDPRETDADSALRAADAAMYQDKKSKSRSRFRLVD